MHKDSLKEFCRYSARYGIPQRHAIPIVVPILPENTTIYVNPSFFASHHGTIFLPYKKSQSC